MTTWSPETSPLSDRIRIWYADITEHPAGEGKLYLCTIKDACSGRIVDYSIDKRMKAGLAVAALHNALTVRGPVPCCVLHTDRGSQFRSKAFVRVCATAACAGRWAG